MPKRVEVPVFEAADFEAADFEAATFGAAGEWIDPLADVPFTGDPEADNIVELAKVKTIFMQKTVDENKRREKATDSEYWCCLCFQNREQVEAFLRAVAEDPNDKYIDGQRLAKRLGIEVPADTLGYGRVKIDLKLAAIAD